MSLLFSLLAFALILSPVVFIHELGHYLIARIFGVQVDVFSVGFGPSLWSYTSKKTGTLWKIGIIPLGGYAKFAGDENAASSIHQEVKNKDPHSSLITHKSPWQVALIGFGGPLANYILSFILMFGVLTFVGNPTYEPILNVQKNSLAYVSGLRSGDHILAFDMHKIESFQDIVEHLRHKPKNQEISLLVKHQTEEKKTMENEELQLITIKNEKISRKLSMTFQDIASKLQNAIHWKTANHDIPKESWLETLGIEVQGKIKSYEKMSMKDSIGRILKAMNPLNTFSSIRTVQDLKRFKGPIGILETSGEIMKTNLGNILMFMASLSIGLGFFNLIPLPLLDGGRILMSFIEIIIRRPLSVKLQEILSFGAMLFLGAFFLYISWNDLMNLKAIGPLLSLIGLK